MTIEQVCFVSPQDIEAVQFQCASCKGSVTVPINKLGSGDLGIVITSICTHCRVPSGFQQGTSDFEHVMNFHLILGRLAEIMKGKNLQFSFRVKCPEK